jgi:enamine deaminase RidA (YjgF/YER057c/UK114 family)
VIARGILPIRYDNPRARIPEGIEQQTALVMAHVQQLLKQAGVEQSQIVTIDIALANFSRDFERMDGVYRTIFDMHPGPARSCIGVSELPEGALIQLGFMAAR